jgi:hypothetical protein
MKNIVGQVPRGDNFFRRDEIINKIYQRLDANAHLYLFATRRMGKTAILRHLEDQPRTGYEFKYLITESINHPITYLNELAKTLQRFNHLGKRTVQFIREWLPKLRWSLFENEVEVGFIWEKHHDLFKEFKNFVKNLNTESKKVVVIIDNFPQMIQNIANKHGADTAKQFLQFNHEIRQLANSNLGFIFTGSTNLSTVTKKTVNKELEATQTISDLTPIEIPPFSRSEATTLVTQLLEEASINYQPDAIEKLLQHLGSFHPSDLQLAVQEIIDEFESNGQVINSSAIKRKFTKMLHLHKDNHFEHYYQSLKTFTQTIKDLKNILIPPLSNSQATTLVTQLLDKAGVAYQPDTSEELLRYLGFFHPFYLQLAVQEIIDEFESTGRTIDSPAVERALNKILHRRNDHYFEHDYQHLKTVLAAIDFQLALAILNALATHEHGLNRTQIKELAIGVDNLDFVLHFLEFDGYLSKGESEMAGKTIYHFTSPILRKWWKLRVVDA